MRVLLLCLAAVLTCVPASSAAVAGTDADGLAIVDDVGERDRLVVRLEQGDLTVRDSAPLRATAGCASQTPFALLCASPFSDNPRENDGGRVLVDARAGDDRVDVRRTTCCLIDDITVRGGPGDDELPAAEEYLFGGAGDDLLRGAAPGSRCAPGRDVYFPSRIDLFPSVAADCERVRVAPGLTFGRRPAIRPTLVVLRARLTGARVRGRVDVSAAGTRVAAGRITLTGDGPRVVVLRRTGSRRRAVGRAEDLRVVLTPDGARPRGYRLLP